MLGVEAAKYPSIPGSRLQSAGLTAFVKDLRNLADGQVLASVLRSVGSTSVTRWRPANVRKEYIVP